MPELAASLDPDLRTMLEGLAAAGMETLAGATVDEARSEFRTLTVGTRRPEHVIGVGSVEEVEVDGADGALPARVYRPVEAEVGGVPTIVFFHGGGFVIGDLDTHDNQARIMCRDVGAVVVSVEYRLCPEHPWSAAAEDCEAATRWTFENIDRLGGDTGALAVAGDSAGGHCAAVVAQACRDAGGPPLAAQLLIYPTVDMGDDWPSIEENAEGYFLTREDMVWFRGHFAAGADPDSPRCSPLRGDLGGLPPAVVVTAELDPLRDQGNAYARALADAGVPVEHRCFDGLIHGFYGLFIGSPACAEAVKETNAALRGLLQAA
jgi:acetyl esterase